MQRSRPEDLSSPLNSGATRIRRPPREASGSFCRFRVLGRRFQCPALRANPFPEVTDLSCRLPLPTLFNGPEATNLGDLMRFWVRPGVKVIQSFGFSWTMKSTPCVLQSSTLFLPTCHIARQPASMVVYSQQRKKTFAGTQHYVTEVVFVATQCPHPCWGIFAPSPFESRGSATIHRVIIFA